MANFHTTCCAHLFWHIGVPPLTSLISHVKIVSRMHDIILTT